MTWEEKRNAIEEYCIKTECGNCKLVKAIPVHEPCYGEGADIERNYSILFDDDDKGNPYWERITAIAEQQRAKGMSKYGFGLEMNPADILERINHLQEELIDGLMYCEWIKDVLGVTHDE